jgi:hypothetical protein
LQRIPASAVALVLAVGLVQGAAGHFTACSHDDVIEQEASTLKQSLYFNAVARAKESLQVKAGLHSSL